MKWILWSTVMVSAVAAASVLWLGAKATAIKTELSNATSLLPQLRDEILENNVDGATQTVRDVGSHTAKARDEASDPLWTLAGAMPWLGANFKAASEVATSADDVARLGATPLVSVFQDLDWNALAPGGESVDLQPLIDAKPKLVAAAQAVVQSSERLNSIDATTLLPQVSEPLAQAQTQLDALKGGLTSAADAARVAPEMLGATEPRHYLVLIQNNAESRATGGIPGALALLTIDRGDLTLDAQSSASEIGVFDPIVEVDSEQKTIYSARIGKFMQDVNLTPDFPTTAQVAHTMWERKTGQRVDGVISVDPVALGYILDATGPVTITSPELISIAQSGLPTELNGKNVVQTLLSDVYSKIDKPKLQDAYFAGVAQEIFAALSDGNGDTQGLVEGLSRGTEEGRIRLWSNRNAEQSVIAGYPLGGSMSGRNVSPAEFGVYFNDGTGAKMDFYVKRTVQLVKECARDGYAQTTVRVTSTNTAPTDSAMSLPTYVTGDGTFGVPPGSVQTNIVAYGPVQANVETAKLDGQRTDFAPYVHSNRPVGVIAIRLAPGESRTVEYTFGKIVQHTEPNVVVTPTVQDVKDVILPTQNAQCG
ncbi:DUF4012 domain-containing protein [Arthrobacter sp. S39]|uniref:DUF4012 domain-containing protein n=1 Tax=Arthrobacter sp. S39 TaxID=2509720 RepID=UPI00325AAC70